MKYVRLKDFRKNLKLSQKDVSDTLGCTQSYESRMERKGILLNDVQYKRLADAYGEDNVMKFTEATPPPKEKRINKSGSLVQRNPSDAIMIPNAIMIVKAIENLQDEISKLNERISELSERLLSK